MSYEGTPTQSSHPMPPSEVPLIPGKRIYYPELAQKTSLIDLESRVGFIGSEARHVLYHALRHITVLMGISKADAKPSIEINPIATRHFAFARTPR